MKHINAYRIDGIDLDSFDLKCMVVTKGATVDPAVVEAFQGECRISMDPRQFSNLYFSDGISAAMIDTGMNYDQNALRYNWTDEDRRIFEPQATSPFSVRLEGGRAALFYKDDLVDYVTFPKGNDYYAQTAPSGASFLDLSTLQGDEWDSWAYLWPCDYAINGEPCQYCHAGLWSAAEAAAGNPPAPVCAVEDFAAMADYAVKHAGVKSLQITGGSTFGGVGESEHLLAYLEAMAAKTGIENITGDILLFVTAPRDLGLIDEYFARGVDRIGCSVEVWDEELARIITPGKMKFTTRQRHIDAWDYIVKNYGLNKGFTNFVIGMEPIESLREGVMFAAERGIYPGGCIWVCGGCCCNGMTQAPGLDYYRRAKELFIEVYGKYGFIPDRSPMPSDLQAEVYNYFFAE